MPPVSSFVPLPSTSTPENIIDMGLTSTATPYQSPFQTPAIPSSSLESTWSAPLYAPYPQTEVPIWSSPQWSSTNFNHSPQMATSRSEHYAYAPSHTQSFEQIPVTYVSYAQSHAAPNPDNFPAQFPAHSSGDRLPTDHQPWMTSVSAPFPSSMYNQWQYSGPP